MPWTSPEQNIYSSPTILHLDADSFFASCEQAINPKYRGKPVITGKERGIVSAASYEAKRMGVNRGTPLFKVKEICPDAIILPSDYETYSLFSKRIFTIMRRFTPLVEEYSIDEAFADISGLRRSLRLSYPEIAAKIKETIEKELSLTVSVGLASTKVLAKVGSKWQKPSGLTVIANNDIPIFLQGLPVGKVWGIGPQTTSYLNKYGIETALEFIKTPESWILQHLTKPHREIWHELRGTMIYPITAEEKDSYQSISKFKTFTPPSRNRDFIFSQLSKNIENALIKARRHNLAAQKIAIVLRTQEFKHFSAENRLSRPSSFPNEIMPLAQKIFEQIYYPGLPYRATGVVISDLKNQENFQLSLFESPLKFENNRNLYQSIDKMSENYGKHAVFLGTSLIANGTKRPRKDRGDIPTSKKRRAGQINERKFIDLPFIAGEVL